MNGKVKELDVVALLVDIPAKGLVKGQVGTVVEELEEDVYEIEFTDDLGQCYAMLPMAGSQLMPLYYSPVAA